MGINVFIDGAVGTTGLDIAERLSARRDVTVVALDEGRRKDPAARADALRDSDFAILCLPDDAAREAAALARGSRVRLIDASTAHRTADGWAYGFAELAPMQRTAIATADRVSNPGCYPTGFLALVAPLVQRGLIPADMPLTCNAVSGYSGGGKALIARFEEQGRDIAWRGYALGLNHKHVPEMQRHAGLAVPPLFAPAVVPAYRGMVVEVPLQRSGTTVAPAGELLDAWRDHFARSPLVTVGGIAEDNEILLRTPGEPDDRLRIDLFASDDGMQIRMVAKLDNLGKGAGGACVHNLNLMAGLEETAGLRI